MKMEKNLKEINLKNQRKNETKAKERQWRRKKTESEVVEINLEKERKMKTRQKKEIENERKLKMRLWK